MKILNIVVPDKVLEIASEEAREQKIDLTSLCGIVLSDFFLGEIDATENPSERLSPVTERSTIGTDKFDVATEMPNFPPQSIRFAQQFVDEALKLPNVRAFRKADGRGIGVEPNFVFVEYLMTRGGIGVSLYGSPSIHGNRKIKKGRTRSYSRAKIYTQDDLDAVLPHIRRAYELKFGMP